MGIKAPGPESGRAASEGVRGRSCRSRGDAQQTGATPVTTGVTGTDYRSRAANGQGGPGPGSAALHPATESPAARVCVWARQRCVPPLRLHTRPARALPGGGGGLLQPDTLTDDRPDRAAPPTLNPNKPPTHSEINQHQTVKPLRHRSDRRNAVQSP